MNHTCQQIIREQNFQFGCGRPDATLEIFQRAQDWLDADDGDDDDHAVVIADIEAAYDSVPHTQLLNVVRNSKGVRDYTASGIGFRLTRISDYCDAQRTRAHIAARPHTRSQQLPARDFQLRPVRTGAKPKILADLECALQRATGQVVEIATDGSFREEAQVGAVGVYLNGKAYGAKIVGKICSSTQAELCAIALVATAIANTSSPLLRKWWCDSKSAIARAASARRGDPLAVVLKDAPEITWAKGHAQNMAINAADAAATAAYKTRSRYDLEWIYHAAGITHISEAYTADFRAGGGIVPTASLPSRADREGSRHTAPSQTAPSLTDPSRSATVPVSQANSAAPTVAYDREPDFPGSTLRCPAFITRKNTTELVASLRFAVKAFVAFAVFLTWVVTSEPEECPSGISDWLLTGSVTFVLILLLALVTSRGFHAALLRFWSWDFDQDAAGKPPPDVEADRPASASCSSGENTTVSVDDASKYRYSPRHEACLGRLGWAVTGLACLWAVVWAFVAVAKLKKGSKGSCGTAFTGATVLVCLVFAVMLLLALVGASLCTTAGDEPPKEPVKPTFRPQQAPGRPMVTPSTAPPTLPPLRAVDLRGLPRPSEYGSRNGSGSRDRADGLDFQHPIAP
ncbi:hypothetical protein DIPPA_33060 [Diplonema papillatum]|nr:hypothetical protein DIPPA_33060 [Diplonema papillatum]